MLLLDIKNLTIEMPAPQGYVQAVDRFSLQLSEGQIYSLVGESGSGKSLIAKAIMGVLNPQARIMADRLRWDGKELQHLSVRQRRRIIGRDIAIIFQEASSSLDPTARIGDQLTDSLPSSQRPHGAWWRHIGWRKRRAIELLHKVGIRDHKTCLDSYAHDLSEGECQKVMIAMAIAGGPRLLIADEPTTLVDSYAEDQILRLLARLNQLRNMSILLISSDLHTVARWCGFTTVIYCGHEVEAGKTDKLLKHPRHPYTQALLNSVPSLDDQPKSPLATLRGSIPPLKQLPIGCRLGPRCPYAQAKCIQRPASTGRKEHRYSCHYPLTLETTDERPR